VIGSPKLAVQSFSRGLTTGATRNISVRLSDGGLLITPTNASLGALEPDDLSHFSDGGQQIDGRKSWKEAFLHECMYCARLVAGAVVHPHSTHSAALSILDDVDPSYVLPPLTAYYVMRVGRMPLVPYYPPGHRDWPRRSRGWRHPITRCYCRTMGRW
jgi:ribulose-5-phosphate 4-epimerase/fuculose-1-phosphate aldolase